MAWYAFEPMSNDFRGVGSVAKDPTLFHLDDFEPDEVTHWTPPHVHIWKDRRKRGDFLSHGQFPPVLNARALAALTPVLTHCDILPLVCDEEPLVAINPPLLSGALDHDESVVDWFDESRRASTIHKYAFNGHAMATHPIFRLREDRNLVILSEAFREAVEKHKLRGLYFHPLDATWKP